LRIRHANVASKNTGALPKPAFLISSNSVCVSNLSISRFKNAWSPLVPQYFVNSKVNRKNKRYVWYGLAVVIAGFEERGAFVIDEKSGYPDR
jgi:hypothetical protein